MVRLSYLLALHVSPLACYIFSCMFIFLMRDAFPHACCFSCHLFFSKIRHALKIAFLLSHTQKAPNIDMCLFMGHLGGAYSLINLCQAVVFPFYLFPFFFALCSFLYELFYLLHYDVLLERLGALNMILSHSHLIFLHFINY
jgi:hypothetical protein